MTEGVAWKILVGFAIPIILGNILQQLYNTVDGIVVGNVVDSNALAAIGTCSTLARFFLCFSMGFSNGCGVIISQLYGAKKEEDVKKAFGTGAIIALGIGVVLTVVGVVFHHWILYGLMNVRDEVVLGYANQYFTIYCLGLIFTYAYNFIAYSLRAFGDSRATLYFLGITSVLNVILDLILVRIFGISGAAAATVISQIVCAVVSFIYMTKRHPMLNLKLKEYRLDKEMSQKCISLGVPGILQQCSVSLGNIAMQRLVNSFGATTMAAYTVGTKVEGYLHAPISGLQQSMATYTGQNVGAGKLDRVKKGLYSALIINAVVCVIASAICFFGVDAIAAAFGLEGESLSQAVAMIKFYSYASPTLVCFAAYFSCSGVIHGSGDVGYATFISLTALVSRAVFAYIAVYAFSCEAPILWQSCLVGNAVSMILTWIRYFSGTWKKKSAKIVGRAAH